MRRNIVRSFAVLSCLATALAAAGCSSSPTTSTTTDGGTLAVSPATDNVLTCSSVQFKETGGVGNGSWVATPVGTITPKGGLYSAPTTAPTTPQVTIGYDEGGLTASAVIQVATAFVGSAATVPLAGNDNGPGGAWPFEHAFTANGSRVYTAVLGPTVASGAIVESDVYVSNDSGATFTAAAAYHTGALTCATAAVDAGDPDVVYLVYYAGHGDSTSNTGSTVRLAVSEDGGKTFPTEYIVADSDNSMANFICPDVVSPSADHVIVTGIATNAGSEWAATFVSSSRGQGIGPVGTEGTSAAADPTDPSSPYSGSDTNSGTAKANCNFEDDGSGYGPRVFSNGSGAACVTYAGDFGDCNPSNGFFVQCSADNGGTWTAPLSIATPTSGSKDFLSGAISKGGNVALTWLDSVAGSDEVMIAISKDGGQTFGTPFQYSSAPRLAADGTGAYTFRPVVSWESDDILWLSQTIDGSDTPLLLVDKTCDFGATWSGAVNAGAYEGTSLLSTTDGMVVTGYDKPHTMMVTLPLASGVSAD